MTKKLGVRTATGMRATRIYHSAPPVKGRHTPMPAPDPLDTVHQLKEEIDRLTEEQIEAMKMATFAGLTPDEAKEYEERRAKILELVEQLRMLEEAA